MRDGHFEIVPLGKQDRSDFPQSLAKSLKHYYV